MGDERDCPSQIVRAKTFGCEGANGRVPMSYLCDGEDDCGNNNDEKFCKTMWGKMNKFDCTGGGSTNGARVKELDILLVCDGVDDCGNGADEQGCAFEIVRSKTFWCGGGAESALTIPVTKVCNGVSDCGSNHDEEFCHKFAESAVLRSESEQKSKRISL